MYIYDSLFFRTLKLGRGEGRVKERGRKGKDEGKDRRGGEGRGGKREGRSVGADWREEGRREVKQGKGEGSLSEARRGEERERGGE